MLKFQLATDKDLKEAAIIENRKKYEEERKSRIFNARSRVLGIDHQGLENQIKEKNRLKEIERERDQKFINEEARRDEVLRGKERELRDERRRIDQEINDYRTQYQKREDTREFDITDPKLHQKTLPARCGDNDIRLGISCAQKFLGEDLMSRERKKAQMEQQRAWLQQQIQERRQAEEDRAKADRIIQETLEARDRRANDLEAFERMSRRQIKESVVRFNMKLAAEQECKKLEREKHNDEDNLAEIYNNLTSDMLTENPESAISNFGPMHKITTMYRGMTAGEIAQLQREQTKQADENSKRKTEAEIHEARWETITNNLARTTLMAEQELARKQRSLNQELRDENYRLAEEQKSRNNYFDKVVYTNPPTQEYFNQFNTTTR